MPSPARRAPQCYCLLHGERLHPGLAGAIRRSSMPAHRFLPCAAPLLFSSWASRLGTKTARCCVSCDGQACARRSALSLVACSNLSRVQAGRPRKSPTQCAARGLRVPIGATAIMGDPASQRLSEDGRCVILSPPTLQEPVTAENATH